MKYSACCYGYMILIMRKVGAGQKHLSHDGCKLSKGVSSYS